MTRANDLSLSMDMVNMQEFYEGPHNQKHITHAEI